MALKPDRIELADGSRIKYFMNEVAERGIVVVLDTPGGEGMDDPTATVSVPAAATGNVPAGVLMNDVVNLNLIRQHINWHRDEVQVGNKVDLIRRGVVRTNMVASGDTPAAGDAAHYGADGEFTTTTDSVKVGTFVSELDAEGYVEVEVSIV
jgi:hypothetical protein